MKRNRPGSDPFLMPYLGVTEDTVTEPQRKLTVTKRSIPGIKGGQSDQRNTVDSERGHDAFSEYRGPQ